MGIRGLSVFIKNLIPAGFGYSINNPLENYRDKTFAIDFNQLLYKYLLMNYQDKDIYNLGKPFIII